MVKTMFDLSLGCFIITGSSLPIVLSRNEIINLISIPIAIFGTWILNKKEAGK